MASLEMLSGRSKKEYAKEAEAVAGAPDNASTALASNGAATDALEAVVAIIGRRLSPPDPSPDQPLDPPQPLRLFIPCRRGSSHGKRSST